MFKQKLDNNVISEILQLSERKISNRKIGELLNINRNTVNRYIRFYNSDIFVINKIATSPRVIKENSRFSELIIFFDNLSNINPKSKRLIWKQYCKICEEPYSYSQFKNVFNLRFSLKNENKLFTPILFIEKFSDNLKAELESLGLAILYFPFTEVYFAILLQDANRDKQLVNFFISVNQTVNYSLKRVSIYSKDYIKNLNLRLSSPFIDWMSRVKHSIFFQVSYTPELHKVIDEIKRDIKIKNKIGLVLLTNIKQKTKFKIPVEKHFGFFEKNNLTKVLKSFPQLRKFLKAKVQKMSHIYLPEDRHYYSVPTSFIGEHLHVWYCDDWVSIYKNQLLISEHNRNYTPFKYSTDINHVSKETVWSSDYFYMRAQLIGPNVKLYIGKLFNQYITPHAGFKQANAILLLKNKYTKIEVDNVCKIMLNFPPYNYHKIKRELECYYLNML